MTKTVKIKGMMCGHCEAAVKKALALRPDVIIMDLMMPKKDGAVATAIALALEAEAGGEAEVAIATALHLFLSDAVHDVEPGIITIRKAASAWDDKQLNFRKLPRK